MYTLEGLANYIHLTGSNDAKVSKFVGLRKNTFISGKLIQVRTFNSNPTSDKTNANNGIAYKQDLD